MVAAAPLWITPLAPPNPPSPLPDEVGHYEVLQRLVSEAPNNSGHQEAELATALEVYVSPEGTPLWRRVVVRSGPTCPVPVIHASFQLPNEGGMTATQPYITNVLCWAAFPERPNHPLLCVLANPTLLCIWDVYPGDKDDGSSGRDGGGGGEGHSIPLPFEASSIHSLSNGRGLLLQRVETLEDHLEAGMVEHHSSWTTHPLVEEEDDDDDDDEDGFVLKAPPSPVRTSLDTLNLSTTTGGNPNVGSAIPSLFSLSHPLDDVLPISNHPPIATASHENIHGEQSSAVEMVTDVFEKILFVGTLKWTDPKEAYLKRKEQSRSVCVTYHTQRKRHAIWEVQEAPSPPLQAPLWQVSSQWRSDNRWSSHLGVFHQDLEDMELLGGVAEGGDGPAVGGLISADGSGNAADSSQYYDTTVTRKDALADALGIRKTPRKAVDDGAPRARTTGVWSANRTQQRPSKSSVNPNNMSLLSPAFSRSAHNDSTVSHVMMDVDASVEFTMARSNSKPPLLTMGPFASLHPKIAMTCLYEETKTCSEPASNVFVASNLEGSGQLTVCLVCQGTKKDVSNTLRMFSMEPRDLSNTMVDATTPTKSSFVLGPPVSIPCLSASPVESSQVAHCFRPHPKHRTNQWRAVAVDILVLQSGGQLSLYRGSMPVVDCALRPMEDSSDPLLGSTQVVAIANSVGNRVDLVYQNTTANQKKEVSMRASLSLKMDSCAIGEKILGTLESAIHGMSDLSRREQAELALKFRCDCIRLEQALDQNIARDKNELMAIRTVLAAIFQFELFGTNVNDGEESSNLPVRAPPMDRSAWEQLLKTTFHQEFELESPDFLFLEKAQRTFEPSNQPLFSLPELSRIYASSLDCLKSMGCRVAACQFWALHSLYEDYKLQNSAREAGTQALGTLLSTLCSLGLEETANPYLQHYQRDLGEAWYSSLNLSSNGANKKADLLLGAPFSILSWIDGIISGEASQAIEAIGPASINTACYTTSSIVRIFEALYTEISDMSNMTEQSELMLVKRDHRVVRILVEEGFKDQTSLRDDLPIGVALPLLEVLHRCRAGHRIEGITVEDPIVWSLIGREDLRKNSEHTGQSSMDYKLLADSMKQQGLDNHGGQADDFHDKDLDGICPLELSSSMIFPEDNRIREVGRMLRSSRPVYLSLLRAIEVSDHDYERLKQEKLLLLSRRILALPLGRGMFTIGNLQPVPAEPLPLPELCLVGRVPLTNAMLALDTTECPADLKVWPDFHNGVAAGLRLPLECDAGEMISKITRTWIVYNRPDSQQSQNQNNATSNADASQDLGHSHGGLLMALGLRGHLTTLEMTDIFDYLTQGTVTTTVGVLLGMAANMRGSCDISVSKMLCLHIPSLIPQHFSAIDVASSVQAAAVSGAGLLYQGSSHRMMTEFLLNEIGKRPSNDVNVVDREAYTLSCGMALGMVNLCQGEGEGEANGNAGLADLRIEERLYRYIVGGLDDAEMRRRRDEGDRLSLPTTSASNGNEKCSCVYEGESINTDVTAPGATLALGLIYMMSGNKTIASAVSLPDTHFLLEYVRPDFLMLRVIARSLILWNEVEPSPSWVEAQLPVAVRKAYAAMREQAENIAKQIPRPAPGMNKDFDRQAVRLIYAHVIAGACFSIGVRFAGTGNREAAAAIFERVMEFRDLRDGANSVSVALRPAAPVLEMCLGCTALSLSMVLAGTGDMETLRLLKVLRWRCDEEINYGSHMAYGSAIGLLFLGGGTSTLGRDPQDIAALVMAFYPRFPSSTSDNQYHLQALRNLYALAVKRRDLRAIDVDTRESVFVPLQVHFENTSTPPLDLTAPCLLVNTSTKPCVLRVVSERYYPVSFSMKDRLGGQILFVKRRSAHLSYKQDPESKRSLLIQTGSLEGVNQMNLLSSFTDDHTVLAFAKHFCGMTEKSTAPHIIEPFSIESFCRRALFECLMLDTQECLSVYLALRAAVDTIRADSCPSSAIAWDFRLVRSYYTWRARVVGDNAPRILNRELVTYLNELLEKKYHSRTRTEFEETGISCGEEGAVSILHDFPLGTNPSSYLDGGDDMDLS